MKKKGFTLVELLAVIVILSLLLIVTIPTVLNVVDEVQKFAFKTNVKKMIKEAQSIYILDERKKEFTNEKNSLENGKGYTYKITLKTENGGITGDYFVSNEKFKAEGNIPFKDIDVISISSSEPDYPVIDSEEQSAYNLECKDRLGNRTSISYKDFGAKGDGKTNDAFAIYYAHKCANDLNKHIEIFNSSDKYLISSLPKEQDINGNLINVSIEIKTNVNWNNSTIIVDDTKIRDDAKKRTTIVFVVPSTRYLLMAYQTAFGYNLFEYNSTDINFSNLLYKDSSTKTYNPFYISSKGDLTLSELNKYKAYYIGLLAPKTIKPKTEEEKKEVEKDEIKRVIYTKPAPNTTEYDSWIDYGYVEKDPSYKMDYFKVDTVGKLLDNTNLLYEYKHLSTGNTNIRNNQIIMYGVPKEQLELSNVKFITKSSDLYACSDRSSDSSKTTPCNFGPTIKINRSNVIINNLNHDIENDGKPMYYGQGFLSIGTATDIQLVNSNFRSHLKTASDGTPLINGTYEIGMANSTNITFDNVGYYCKDGESQKACYEANIISENYGTTTGAEYIKNWTIKNSKLNRIDSHHSLRNLTIENSIIGKNSIRVAGEGDIKVSDSSFDQAESMISLREDYGSSWKGEIKLDNIYFNPLLDSDRNAEVRVLKYNIPGIYDFGYNLYIPSIKANNIIINNEDANSVTLILVHNAVTSYISDFSSDSPALTLNKYTTNSLPFSNWQSYRPYFYGNMSFQNIHPESKDKEIQVSYPLRGSSSTIEKYCVSDVCYTDSDKIYGIDRAHINYYNYNTEYPKPTLDINMPEELTPMWETEYFKKDYSFESGTTNGSSSGNNNAINLNVSEIDHPYCRILVKGTKNDGWYTGNVTLELDIVGDGTVSNFGLTYDNDKKGYEQKEEKQIGSDIKGAFNAYGKVTIDGKEYKCVKLVKKA